MNAGSLGKAQGEDRAQVAGVLAATRSAEFFNDGVVDEEPEPAAPVGVEG